MAISKIILNGVTQMDVTQDTVASTNLLSGYTATKNDGTKVSGAYVPPSAPTLQTKSVSYTPSETAQSGTVTADSGYDGLSSVDISVGAISSTYVGSGVTRCSSSDVEMLDGSVLVGRGYYSEDIIKNMPSGSATPALSISATDAIVSTGTNTLTLSKSVSNTPQVTAGYVSSGTAGNSSVSLTASINTRSSSDLTVSGATVTVPSGYYSVNASKSVASGTQGLPSWSTSKGATTFTVAVSYPNATEGYYHNIDTGSYSMLLEDKTVTPSTSQQVITPTSNVHYLNSVTVDAMPTGTAGTPTATKGTVSNHSVSVTPSVTNTTGYITGGTKTGTAVTVSASELVSGTETKTENGTYDVTNLASVVVNVGGSSSVQTGIGQGVTGTNDSLIFAVLGNPTSFSLIYTGDITIGETPIVSAIAFDGTNYVGQIVTNTANAQASYISTGFSHTYYSSEQGIQINSTDAVFSTYSNYKLVYTYGGSSSDIHTANVQVGSGATSITFSSLSGRPIYWSCVFKSNFSTSSGYQRVIATGNDGSSTYGLCLDSSAHASSSYWTASYSGGSLTISSQGTNQGGYFHQPGYYQLTYAVDDSAVSYQTKTVTPTTSQQIITADSGYDALSQVTVNAMPTGVATSATTISGTAATVSTGTNTLTLTKTVSNTPRITTAGYISTGTAGNSSVTLTANVTTKAAATITPGTTNQTIAAGTYITGTQTIAGDADLVGSNIISTANIFGVQGTVTIQKYYTGASAPSSSLGNNGDIYLQE